MPLINYKCGCAEIQKKYFKSVKDAPSTVQCMFCNTEGRKVFGTTSSSHKITIDNGLMAKSVEVDPEIMEINDERSSRDYSEED